MKTVIIKVADATPRQIDWLVAQCEGLNPNADPERRRQFVGYPGFAEANGFDLPDCCFSIFFSKRSRLSRYLGYNGEVLSALFKIH